MKTSRFSDSGFSVFELIATLGLALVLGMIAIMNLKELDDPLKNGSEQLAAFFKQARAKAVSSTSAYTVVPVSSTEFITRYGTNCADATSTEDNDLILELPTGAYITDTAWTLCYSARGVADGNLNLDIRDADGAYKTIEVFLGGAVRVQ